ncbi:MAG: LuxR C-terminal-related transcriptional regulator [Candidatus Limnocylindria bacterium]
MTTDPDIARGREALARRDWAQAYDSFGAADQGALTGADLEGRADAAWWLSKLPESLEIRRRAYAAFDAEGDDAAATAVAARLAIEHFIRGETSVGGGFLMKAHRHAADLPEGRERGFLALIDGTVARFAGDLDGSIALIAEALRLGRTAGDPDLIAMAIHTEGLVLVDQGKVDEGLALLDEAMASIVAGEVDPYFTGIIYCDLIGACLSVSDLRRAGEWSDAARAWCDTIPPDSPYPGMCRANRAEVARLRGAWPEAEAEAVLATEQLMVVDPAIAAAAFLQVAEIRRRTGDLVGAEAAYTRAHELGQDPQPGLALLRLAQGKTDAARSAIDAALEGEPRAVARTKLLAARVDIALAEGEIDAARAGALGLAVIAEETGTPAFAAMATTAAGAVALAEDEAATALAQLRDAVAAWQDLRLPYEAARARVLYARALRASGDDDGAALELRAALAMFEGLGAVPDAEATRGLLGAPGALPAGLTAREAEVLRLVASGKTNRDIAVELVISEHTVSRHLQNMYAKLGVSSRSAATAFAFEHGLA